IHDRLRARTRLHVTCHAAGAELLRLCRTPDRRRSHCRCRAGLIERNDDGEDPLPRHGDAGCPACRRPARPAYARREGRRARQLVTQMGLAYIRGLQGDDLADGVIATAKHFVGYGASEGGFNWAPAHLNERELRDVYLRPFEAAVRTAALGSVMSGYHVIDGI